MKKSKTRKSRMAVNSAASKKEYKQFKKESNVSDKKSIKKVLIIIGSVIIIGILLCLSGIFNIKEVNIEGNSNISNEQILSFSKIEFGKNLFSFSKKDVENSIMQNAYISDVKVKRIFPDKINIKVEERNVDYVLQLASSYVYVSKQGYILQISNEKPDVPIILGFKTDLSNIKENDRLEDEDLEKMNVVLKIMEIAENNNMKNLISKIDISNKTNYTIYLEAENKIAYLGNELDLNTKFLYIKAILKENKDKKGEIFVNVDFNSEYAYFRENT